MAHRVWAGVFKRQKVGSGTRFQQKCGVSFGAHDIPPTSSKRRFPELVMFVYMMDPFEAGLGENSSPFNRGLNEKRNDHNSDIRVLPTHFSSRLHFSVSRSPCCLQLPVAVFMVLWPPTKGPRLVMLPSSASFLASICLTIWSLVIIGTFGVTSHHDTEPSSVSRHSQQRQSTSIIFGAG